MTNNIIDSKVHDNIDVQLKIHRKKTLIRIVGLIIFNTVMFVVFIKGISFADKLVNILSANLIGFNIVGFILGIIVAIFPYKDLSY